MKNNEPTKRYISNEEFYEIIKNYFYLKDGIIYEVVPDVRIKETAFGETPDMTVYLEGTNNGEKVRFPLSEDEIKTILSNHVESPKEALDSYLYHGGIHYFYSATKKDYADFTGVFLYIRQKPLKERITQKIKRLQLKKD